MALENGTAGGYDFGALHAAMRRYVDGEILPCVSSAVLVGRDVVDVACAGWADRERREPLRTDHVFRVFSNSKLVTSCAALLLLEEGRFALDDPVERWLPQLAGRRVLRPGATTLDDTEPARRAITIRHLLGHAAGLAYGILPTGSPLDDAYRARAVLDAESPLAAMIDTIAPLPLAFHPGEGWAYSIALDVVGRLVEVLAGERFDAFVERRIFAPLGMTDTRFAVRDGEAGRLVGLYAGADPLDPSRPGLSRVDDYPWPGAFVRPVPRLSGGWGMVSTLPDMVALVRGLLPGGPTLLKPETLALMASNQLPPGRWIGFPRLGEIVGRGHGLAGAVTVTPTPYDPPGELQWGGIAGTHWWISPRAGVAGVIMTQRHWSFWNPFYFELKQHAQRAARR